MSCILKSLLGKKILVTRPKHQAAELSRLIEAKSGVSIDFPLINIQAKSLSAKERAMLVSLDHYDFIFFISVNAVNFALKLIDGKIEQLQQACVVAVGKATAQALAEAGVNELLTPKQGFNSEAVLALPECQLMSESRCLIVRGDGGRELLACTLRDRGAEVDYIEVYEKSLPQQNCEQVKTYLQNKEISAILIYSAIALDNLMFLLAGDKLKESLLSTPLVVISSRISVAAKKIGFKQIIVAAESSDAAMVNALFNGDACG